MKSRPIIFSTTMVRALLAGRKTQTRRLVKMPADAGDVVIDPGGTIFGPGPYLKVYKTDRDDAEGAAHPRIHCPYGYPGDRLWVRETHAQFAIGNRTGDAPLCVAYRASCGEAGEFDYVHNGDEIMQLRVSKWTPAIFMPRWASRIELELTAVRAQRLDEITEDDAKAEGVEPFFTRFPEMGRDQRITSTELARDAEHRASFACLWDEINGDRALWVSNPWVWALTFRVVPTEAR